MLFLQLMIDGLGKGAIYAGLALSLVLVFRATGMVNFAQGEMATLSVFFTWFLTQLGFGVWLALGITVVLAAAMGALLQATIIRPIMGAPHLTSIAMLIGLFIAINAMGQVIFGPNPRRFPSLFPDGALDLLGIRVSYALLGVLAVELIIVVILWLFFERTKMGLAFRAVATGPAESPYVGVSVQRIFMLGWGLAAGVGAVAAALLTNLGFYLEPNMMVNVLVYSLAAATLGGFGSPVGAMAAGFLIGVLENLGSFYIPGFSSDLGLTVALVGIIGILVLRPQGLAGRAATSRV